MKIQNINFKKYTFGVLCICIMLIYHGAIPYLSMPNFQQAIWAQGFAKSFSNQSLFSIFANNFGFPAYNPISFGLSAMFTSSIFTRIGFGAAESYTFTFLFFLVIGFVGTYKWARIYLNEISSFLASLIWTIQPINLLHSQSYSMLGLGIILLPTYCYIIYKFYNTELSFKINTFYWSSSVLVTFLISVFMDGYTFVMFSFFSVISWVFLSMIKADKSNDKNEVYKSIYKLSVVFISLAISYLSYSFYFDGSNSWTSSIEFYRGWGVDLSFLILPTYGRNFIADILNFSIERSPSMYFGDASVWKSTYCLPILIFYITSIFKRKNNTPLFYLMLFVSFFSLYLAMGPSLKFFSSKPSPNLGQLMDSKYAVMSLGTEALWVNIPGLKSMRASYRWLALFIFSAWILMIKFVSELSIKKRRDSFIFAVLVFVFILSIPNINKFFPTFINNRVMMNEVENQLSNEIAGYINQDEIALFLPMKNDFIVNSLASYGEFKTYNIGGDKNVIYAKKYLPSEILEFNNLFLEDYKSNFESLSYSLMLNIVNNNNVIIIPYFSTEAPNRNYCFKSILEDQSYKNCVLNNQEKINYEPLIAKIRDNKKFTLIEKDMYVIIKRA